MKGTVALWMVGCLWPAVANSLAMGYVGDLDVLSVTVTFTTKRSLELWGIFAIRANSAEMSARSD